MAVGFELLVTELRNRRIPVDVVDLFVGRGSAVSVGGASAARGFQIGQVLVRYLKVAWRGNRCVYLTIAQSRHGFWRDFIIIWFARARGHRIVTHLKGGNYHGFYLAQPRWLQWVIRATLRQVNSMVVLGEGLRHMFDFEPSLATRIQVVPNGVPFETGPIPPKTLDIEAEPARLLFLSNLIESKGYLDVLVAVGHLVEAGIDVRCDFCGQFVSNADDRTVKSVRHAKQLFDELVVSHRLENHVRFHGQVSGDVKRAMLQNAHFFILPTRYDVEGQPISILEAMAFGAVVISTRYRAIPDMVVDGETGILVEFGQPDEIAARIKELAADPHRYREMSAAALCRVRERFTRERHLTQLLGILAPDCSSPGLRPQ